MGRSKWVGRLIAAARTGSSRRSRKTESTGIPPLAIFVWLASLGKALFAECRRFLSQALRGLAVLTGVGRRLPSHVGRRRSPLFSRARTGLSRRSGQLALVAAVIGVVATFALPGALAAQGQTFVVTSTADETDRSPGDGNCAAASGDCTLRAAIMESNALSGRDTIQIVPGVYELEIPTLNEDTGATGDYDITNTVTIEGAGMPLTVIDAGWPLEGSPVEERGMDRLFEVHPNASYVLFKDLTLREAYTDEGGAGIQNWNKGTTRLERVMVKDSLSAKVGGGINHDEPSEYPWLVQPTTPPRAGRLEIVDSIFKGNASGGGGAAINNSGAGHVTISGSQIVDNPGLMIPDPTQPQIPGEEIELVPAPGVYEPDSPAIVNQAEFDVEGSIKITDSLISGNFAHHDGAGLFNGG